MSAHRLQLKIKLFENNVVAVMAKMSVGINGLCRQSVVMAWLENLAINGENEKAAVSAVGLNGVAGQWPAQWQCFRSAAAILKMAKVSA
jgi:hypothetical protein